MEPFAHLALELPYVVFYQNIRSSEVVAKSKHYQLLSHACVCSSSMGLAGFQRTQCLIPSRAAIFRVPATFRSTAKMWSPVLVSTSAIPSRSGSGSWAEMAQLLGQCPSMNPLWTLATGHSTMALLPEANPLWAPCSAPICPPLGCKGTIRTTISSPRTPSIARGDRSWTWPRPVAKAAPGATPTAMATRPRTLNLASSPSLSTSRISCEWRPKWLVNLLFWVILWFCVFHEGYSLISLSNSIQVRIFTQFCLIIVVT